MKPIWVILYVSILLVGCSKGAEVERIEMKEEMPSDFAFKVSYGYGETQKNSVNTFDQTVTKDLIAAGTASASLTLTEEELKTIYKRMYELNVPALTELAPRNTTCSQIPYEEDTWEIRMNGTTITRSWSSEHCKLTEDAEQLKLLRNEVMELIQEKPEYKQLPEAQGGYD